MYVSTSLWINMYINSQNHVNFFKILGELYVQFSEHSLSTYFVLQKTVKYICVCYIHMCITTYMYAYKICIFYRSLKSNFLSKIRCRIKILTVCKKMKISMKVNQHKICQSLYKTAWHFLQRKYVSISELRIHIFPKLKTNIYSQKNITRVL